MRVAHIPFLVFGKAPVFAGCMSELLNILRVAQILKHLNDLMAIKDDTGVASTESSPKSLSTSTGARDTNEIIPFE